MPRTAQVRYYPSRGAYYTKIRGVQHLLASGPKDEPDGPTYKAAVLRFSQLLNLKPAAPRDDCQVGALIIRHYHMLKCEGRASTLRTSRCKLDPAIKAFGHIKVADLKPYVVNDWLAEMTTWNTTTKHIAVSRLISALNWAKKTGLISTNPLDGMAKPEAIHRDANVVLPPALQSLLIAHASPALAHLLTFLRDTGCRPGEAVHAEAKHIRPGRIVFPWNPPPGEWRWKNAAKTKRDRVIYLTPALEEMVRDVPGGPLFRTTRGKTWTESNLVVSLIALRRKPPIMEWCAANQFDPSHIFAYSFRHSYITRMLLAGCPIKLLADLCGTSVLMIERTYSHAHDDHEAMRKLFLQFSHNLSEII
jgi:integrase